MEVVKSSALFFVLALTFGTFLFSPMVNPSKTGGGFLRLITGISLFGIVVSFLISFYLGLEIFSLVFYLFAAIFVMLAIYFKLIKDENTKLNSFFYLLIISCFSLLSFKIYSIETSRLIFFLSSVAFIGITNYAMTLGHYYLVVPKLSEKPLVISMKILWVILLVKLIASSVGVSQNLGFFTEGTTLGGGYAFNWLLLLMRLVCSYLALGILSIFAYKLCKMRSIQSATGVFYIMVFFIFIGEIMGAFLHFSYGLVL